MSNVAAFFDLDGTLYREGLITEIFKKMVKYEIIETERWYNDVRPDYLKWDKRQGDYDDYLLKMTDIYIESIKGLEKSQMEYIAKKYATTFHELQTEKISTKSCLIDMVNMLKAERVADAEGLQEFNAILGGQL